MDREEDRKCMKLLNEGSKAAESGDMKTAERLWHEALQLDPSPGLEAMLRRSMVILYFIPLKDLPEKLALNPEQATQFSMGEPHFYRLAQLLDGSAPGGSAIDDLDEKTLLDFRKFLNFQSKFVKRLESGSWTLPKSIPWEQHLFSSGEALASMNAKKEALPFFLRALDRLEPSKPEHKEMRKQSFARVSALFNDLGDKVKSGEFAKMALAQCEFDKDDTVYLMLQVSAQMADEPVTVNAKLYEWKNSEAKNLVKRADIRIAKGDEDPDATAKLYKQAISLEQDCEDPSVYASLGNCLFKTKQFDEAERNLKKALELNDQNHGLEDNKFMLFMVYRALGGIALYGGKLDEKEKKRVAVEYWEKALIYLHDDDLVQRISQAKRELSGGGGGSTTKKSGCFIATAAFGSTFAPEVNIFRIFRDKVLSKTGAGRCFIAIYYRLSPPISAVIVKYAVLQRYARQFLRPIARFLSRRLDC